MAKANKRTTKPRKSKERIPSKSLPWWWMLVPPLVTVVFYIPAFQLGWTNWDDPRYVLENEAMLQHDWGALLTQAFVGNFHPLTMLSLGIDHWLFDDNAGGYHVVNLVIHALTTVLVFELFQKLSKNGWVGLFVALWFGVHPLHVESVAWIAERKDVLYGFFFIAGMLSYLRYQKDRTTISYTATLVFFILSVLSKAMGVVFPLIMILLDYWESGKLKQKKADLVPKVPFFVIALGLGITAFLVQQKAGAVADLEVLTWYNRLSIGLFGLAIYPIKLLFPYELSNVYPYPRLTASGMLPFQYYVLALGGIGLLIMLFIQWKRRKMLMFWSLAFYVITIALVTQWLSIGSSVMADRYSYLASLGIFFIVIGGSAIHLSPIRRSIPWLTILSALTLIYGIITWNRIPVWENSETLWRDMIHKYPNRYATAYKNLGNYLAQEGNIDEAFRLLNTGSTVDPFDAEIQESLGNVNSIKGNPQQAIRNFDEALKLDPNLASAHLNRGIAYSIVREFKLALADFDKAQEMGIAERKILPNRSFALLSSGKLQDAISGFLKCIEYNPKDGSYDYFISQAYFNSGDLQTARRYLNSARQKGYTDISADYQSKFQ